MKRREFLKYASIAGGIGAFPQILSASSDNTLTGFKAIVLVDLQGGNDALNTFIPTGSDAKTGYSNYKKERGSGIAIPDTNLMDALRNRINNSGQLEIGSPSENPYYANNSESKSYMKGFYLLDKHNFDSKIAVNALMPEVAYWMDRGRGAVVQNIGNISAPYTKAELKADKRKLPPSIFAHNVQHLLTHLGSAGRIKVPTGWLGKLADQWGNINNDPVYKMNINLSSYATERAMFGASSRPMNYGYKGPTSIKDKIDSDFEDWVTSHSDANDGMFESLYRELRRKGYVETVQTAKDWNTIGNPFGDLTDAYGKKIFTGEFPVKGDMGISNPILDRVPNAFVAAAKVIAIAKQKGFNRIAISITVGGFDQHSNHKGDHSIRLRGLSYGADLFMRAMEAKGWLDQVAVVSLSEFSRSTVGNGDGSDHAWGGSQFVLGAVNPGNYGEFPDLTAGSDRDISTRGRLIPTTSYSQYYGKVLKWFGASDAEIAHALPELANFSSAASASKLGFMKNA